MVGVRVTEKLETLYTVLVQLTAHDLFRKETVYYVEELGVVFKVFIGGESGQFLVVGSRVGLEDEEGDVVAQDVFLAGGEVEIESVGDGFVVGGEGGVEDAVAPADLGVVVDVVVVGSHVGVEVDLDICNFWVVDVVLVDLFGDDEETHIVLLLEHDLHLVHDELQLLSLIHRPVGLHLHFLQNRSRLHNVVVVLFPPHDQHYAPSVLHLHTPTST